jgi:DNA-directed RNA polymerase subunit RPC12/RpoP
MEAGKRESNYSRGSQAETQTMKFNCPKCKRPLEAKPNLIGNRLQCPTCGAKIKLPTYLAESLRRFYVRSVN